MSDQPSKQPSGLAWAPEVPAHWTVKKLGFLASLQSGDSITAEDIKDDGPYPVYGGNGLRGYTDRFTHDGEYALIGRQGALCGNINYARGEFWASEHAVVVAPREEIAVRWLGELLRAMELNQYSVSAAQPGLSVETIAALRVPIPPLKEQRAIADYLDRETARLDALVEAKELVLGLLAEKRRSLISSVVTRGLDTRAPLRASGIPWLGHIPVNWQIWKLGHIAVVGNGSTPNRDNQEFWLGGSIPWLNSSVVNQDEVTAADQFVTDVAVRECHLPLVRSGSVLVGLTGQGKTRGQAVVLSFDATINQHLAFVTPSADRLDTWYLRWALHAAYEFLRSISDDAGGTKGALTCEEVAALRVPVPPIAQQRAIADHVSVEIAKFDEMRVAIERTIVLLMERRAALIAAAVTGQIEVNGAA